jgi:hypothetical protein
MQVGQGLAPTRRFYYLPLRIGQVIMQGDNPIVLNGHDKSLGQKVKSCFGFDRSVLDSEGFCGSRKPESVEMLDTVPVIITLD